MHTPHGRPATFAPDGGESQRAFYHRVLHALEPIVAAHPGGRIACVGGVLDCVYRFANGLDLAAPRNYQLLNTSINVVDYADGRAQVVQWADVSHLDAASDDDGYRKVLRRSHRRDGLAGVSALPASGRALVTLTY
jgi:probable phosphoglycerate mutase